MVLGPAGCNDNSKSVMAAITQAILIIFEFYSKRTETSSSEDKKLKRDKLSENKYQLCGLNTKEKTFRKNEMQRVDPLAKPAVESKNKQHEPENKNNTVAAYGLSKPKNVGLRKRRWKNTTGQKDTASIPIHGSQ